MTIIFEVTMASTNPLIAPELDAVALFQRAEDLFAGTFEIERLVAASASRAP